MRRVCVIGAGSVAKVYAEALSGSAFEVFYVDPKFAVDAPEGCFAALSAMPASLVKNIAHWIICTPTDRHESVLRALLALVPAARVLVEKPIVPLSHFPALLELRASYPDARILENCQYEQSAVVEKMLAVVPEVLARKNELRSIHVEFTKNRIHDNRRGRFRDGEYQLVGYEGPHLIAVAEAVTAKLFGSVGVYRASSVICVDKNAPDASRPDEGTGRFQMSAEGLPPVFLHTSMIGEVGDDVLMPKRYSETRRKWIPVRDSDRYRIVRLNFDDEAIVFRFEPQRSPSDHLIRNTQVIYRLRGGQLTRLASFSFNIFADAVRGNLDRLDAPTFASARLMAHSERKAGILAHCAQLYAQAPQRSSESVERRRQWRMEAPARLRLTVNGNSFEGHVTDINAEGFLFECAAPLPLGAPIEFSLAFEGLPLKLEGTGLLRWGHGFPSTGGSPFCFGVFVTQWRGTTGGDIVEGLLRESA